MIYFMPYILKIIYIYVFNISIESYLKNILYLGFPGVVYTNETWLDCSIVTLFSQILVKIQKQRLIILSEIWGRLTWSGPAEFP